MDLTKLSALEKNLIKQNNYFDALRAYCKRKGFPMPKHNLSERDGTWFCTCSVDAPNGTITSLANEKIKRDSRQRASSIMIEQLLKNEAER